MATTNPVTGDLIKTKTGGKDSQKAYEDGWDRIFGKKNQTEQPEGESEKTDADV